MSFTREDLVAYEKSPATPPAAITQENPASPDNATSTPVAEDDSSTSDAQIDDGSLAEENAAAATADADLDSASTDDAADSQPAGKSRAQDRIAELVAERNAYRQYGEHLLKRVNELDTSKTVTETTAPATSASNAADDPPPTMEEHKFDPVAFATAQNEWLKRQVAVQVKAARDADVKNQTEQQQKTEAEKVEAAFKERTEKYAADHKDFKVKIANPALPKLAPATAGLIVRSEYGPHIVDALASDPALALRISKMTVENQAMAIGRLEANIEKSVTTQTTAPPTKPAKPRTVTSAPTPPQPVPAGTQQGNKRMEDMSMDDWVAQERANKIKARQARQTLRASMR